MKTSGEARLFCCAPCLGAGRNRQSWRFNKEIVP